MGRLSPNFTAQEFARACGWHLEDGVEVPDRELTPAELEVARWFAIALLQPARDELGGIFVVWRDRHGQVARGFVRPNSNSHQACGSVDIFSVGVPIYDLYRWFAARRKALPVGRVIYERNHVHLARRGPESWAGDGLAFLEPEEGRYELDESIPLVHISETPP